MKIILLVDALINFALGVLLVIFSPAITNWLGIPLSSTSFYPNILGAIFIGITIALLIDAIRKKGHSNMGLGLLGAISINICGGTMLAIWLIFGDLELSVRGFIILWTIVIILIIVSVDELIHIVHREKNENI